jgi:hypothetical protein
MELTSQASTVPPARLWTVWHAPQPQFATNAWRALSLTLLTAMLPASTTQMETPQTLATQQTTQQITLPMETAVTVLMTA